MRSWNETTKYAVIRASPDAKGEVMYPEWTARLATHRYYSILNDLILHGVCRMEAEATTRWICREAKAGDRRVVDPGVEIVIEEENDEQGGETRGADQDR